MSELSIWVLQIFGHSHALDSGFTQPCANWLICLLMVAYPFNNFLTHSLPYGVWSLHLSPPLFLQSSTPISLKVSSPSAITIPLHPASIPLRRKVLQNCF